FTAPLAPRESNLPVCCQADISWLENLGRLALVQLRAEVANDRHGFAPAENTMVDDVLQRDLVASVRSGVDRSGTCGVLRERDRRGPSIEHAIENQIRFLIWTLGQAVRRPLGQFGREAIELRRKIVQHGGLVADNLPRRTAPLGPGRAFARSR